MNKKELIAYTAGIIDGEGYIGLIPSRKASSLVAKVKVASTDIRLVNFLHDSYGGHLDKPRESHQFNHKKSSCWSLSNRKNVIPFLEKIKPYLIIKREQASLVIDYDKNCSYKAVRNKQTRAGEIIKRMDYYNRLRELNHRGLPPATTK